MTDTKADDSLPRLPTREELQALLEKPLDEGLEYFDATPSIEQLSEVYRGLGQRVVMLERLLQMQGGINGKLISSMNQLLVMQAEQQRQQQQDSAPVLPEHLNS